MFYKEVQYYFGIFNGRKMRNETYVLRWGARLQNIGARILANQFCGYLQVLTVLPEIEKNRKL